MDEMQLWFDIWVSRYENVNERLLTVRCEQANNNTTDLIFTNHSDSVDSVSSLILYICIWNVSGIKYFDVERLVRKLTKLLW